MKHVISVKEENREAVFKALEAGGLSLQEMKKKAEYQGWSNRPTWAVNLWLGNDAGLYEATNELMRAHEGLEADQALQYFIDELIEQEIGDAAGLAHDLVNGALAEVNWTEITNSWKEGMDEEVAEETPGNPGY